MCLMGSLGDIQLERFQGEVAIHLWWVLMVCLKLSVSVICHMGSEETFF